MSTSPLPLDAPLWAQVCRVHAAPPASCSAQPRSALTSWGRRPCCVAGFVVHRNSLSSLHVLLEVSWGFCWLRVAGWLALVWAGHQFDPTLSPRCVTLLSVLANPPGHPSTSFLSWILLCPSLPWTFSVPRAQARLQESPFPASLGSVCLPPVLDPLPPRSVSHFPGLLPCSPGAQSPSSFPREGAGEVYLLRI